MTSRHYRERAERCMQRVQTAADDQERALLLDMAEKWLEMARRADDRASAQEGGHPLAAEDAGIATHIRHDPDRT
ncbi:hypothetical protein ABEG18_22025 [Alsobacter sp. KACC 23698]|uniref:Uncharacterized protein n=1 Tax=Alsobacter sp. KACC 23698 TaxID=3149229 RepID=A0AAU7JE60_9HYPH